MISNKYKLIVDIDKCCCVCFENYNLIKRTKNYYISQLVLKETDIDQLINKYVNNLDEEHNIGNTQNKWKEEPIENENENEIEKGVSDIIDEITNNIIDEKMELDTYLSLNDIEKDIFDDNIIPDDLLIKSCCNKHYICIGCIRKIINNYENHPINENNSHMSCPYPFENCVTNIGFNNIFDHNLIYKICKTQEEWDNYLEHSNRYLFPGYTIIKCPLYIYRSNTKCNTDILVENEILKNANKGDLIIECTQNNFCLKKFCYYCHEIIYNYYSICYNCKTIYENENPNVYNYYFNKNYQINESNISINDTISEDTIYTVVTTDSSIIENEKTVKYDESSYLFKNNEITSEEAVKQLLRLLENINNYMICPICKNSLYKTEKCNALSHHNLERCYACGRIGFQIKGLGDHWNVSGISGCYRFDHDTFIRNYVSEYVCTEYCSNHEKGDCTISEHSDGIKLLERTRIRSYLLHAINSLLPTLRLAVYDQLYNFLKHDNQEALQFLPFKQTLILLLVYKERSRDYCEEIIYKELKCEYPLNIEKFKSDKSFYIDAELYLNNYSISKEIVENVETQSSNSLTIYNNIENARLIDINIDNYNFRDNIYRSLLNTDNFFVNINEPSREEISRTLYVPELTLREYNYNESIEITENNVNQIDEIDEIIEGDITDEIIVYNGRSIIRRNID